MNLSRLLIVGGLLAVGLGVLLHYLPGAFSWFGRLPGDLRFRGERTTVFIPIGSMIVVSVAVSLLLALIARLFDR